MTSAEWTPIYVKLLRRFPNVDWTKWEAVGADDQYAEDLADLPAQHVAAALDVLCRDGRAWPPPAGEVRKAIIELTMDPPEWADAARAIAKCAMHGPGDRRAAAIAEQHPVVQAFVATVGWQEAALAGGGWDGSNRTAEAQVREKWLAFCRRAVRDASLVGLPGTGLPALERANRTEPHTLSAALHRALPRPPEADAA